MLHCITFVACFKELHQYHLLALKIFKRIFMWITLGILGLLLLFAIGVAVFVNTSPQFGQPPIGADAERIATSPNYKDNAFQNLMHTTTGDVWEAMKKMPEMLFNSSGNPKALIPSKFEPLKEKQDTATFVTWYGHSSFLIEMNNTRILIDPMFGKVAAPVPFGTKRFAYEVPIPIASFDNIDAVIISHDHYDHLDLPSIEQLKDKVKHFYTPLGVGSHLKSWGVPEENITELDWWEDATLHNISFVACPSRHFSGRGLTDRDATQWASWVIKSETARIYFSGDGGYGSHFKEIGEKLGPFDFAMVECGQYNLAWKDIHMMPEESVQAAMDVKASLSMPIHWGAFRLAPHAWTDPIERYVSKAQKENVLYVSPKVGERFYLGKEYPKTTWWKK